MNHFEKPQHFNSCKLILATAFIAILAANVQAQKPKIKFQHLTIKDGLSQGPVDCIFQDNKGIIWFGTEDGLNKYDYDSDQLFRYRSDPSDHQNLSSNFVTAIYEDKSDILWIETENGLNQLDRSNNQFNRYQIHSAKINNSLNNKVTEISRDQEGNLWIATDRSRTQII